MLGPGEGAPDLLGLLEHIAWQASTTCMIWSSRVWPSSTVPWY